MLDDAFQIGTDTALADISQRPRAPKPQEPAFSMWGLTRAPDRGLRAGVAEGIASTAEVLGAFGQVLSSTGGSAEGMFSTGTEAERRERDEQARRIREEGVDYRSEAGRSFRNVARDLMPDPVTAHGAEVAVAEFARLGGKAIAAGATLGPLAGAAVAGVEEGFTESEKLAEQVVDVGTRTQAGAVTALLTALGFGIPVAGKTVGGTVGLAVAGGPATFITQQAATREILASAGYDKLADQYDPFDPVGLALSTLVPLGFGALAMRAAARGAAPDARGPDAPPIEAPPGDTPPGARTPIAQAVDELHVDAARVNLLREHTDAQRLTLDNDLRGAEQHQAALARALDQMAAGERVDVSDLAPLSTGRLQEAIGLIRDRFVNTARGVTEAVLERAAQVRAFVAGPAADALDNRSKVNFAEVTEAVRERILADTGVQISAGARQELRADAVRHAQNRHPDLTADDWAALPWLAENFDRATLLKPHKGDQGPRLALSATDPASGAAYVAEFRTGKAGGGERLSLVTFFRDHPNAPVQQAAEARTSATVPGDARSVPNPVDQRTPAQPAGAPVESPAVDAAARELEAANPDLMVQLDGMEQPVRMADLMAQVRQEVAQDLAEVPLIETAAACFLRT